MRIHNSEILQKDAPALRKIAEEVPTADIHSERIQTIIEKMKDVLSGEYDGVGLAAPQIGVSLRIFIVSGNILATLKGKERTPENASKFCDEVYINPSFVKASREKRTVEEGCLSVRPWYGQVHRSTRVRIRALNERGDVIERGASGLLAQIYQHELDHLDGILFIDKATKLREMPELVIRNTPKSKKI